MVLLCLIFYIALTNLDRYSKLGRSVIIGEVLWTEGVKTRIPFVDGNIGVMFNLLLDKRSSLNPNKTNVHFQNYTTRGMIVNLS